MAWSTLNVFQRLARQWDAAHPYNAAQILKISGDPDLSALHATWHDTLHALGLGRVRLDGRSFCYESLNGQTHLYGIRAVPPGVSFEDCISEELNRRFDNPDEPPFRPFVLPADGFHYLGVVYHHWVADSVSIRTVLREWFLRLFDPAKARRSPLTLPDFGYRRFFDLIHQASGLAHGVLTAARWGAGLRQVRRIQYRCGTDLSVRFALRAAPPGLIDTLHQAARRHNATLNDLFMAAIARVSSRYVPLKNRPHRHGLAVGSIVDLRPYSDTDIADAFGLFLGFTNVFCRAQDFRDPHLLLRSIARQNTLQKRGGVPQASALRMLIGTIVGRLVPPHRMAHFYQKHCPMAAGISNVNLNRSWAADYHPAPLLDYIRVSPTGPMMPMVFATTTLGHSFHVALTYRPSVVSPDRINPLAADFLDYLNSFIA